MAAGSARQMLLGDQPEVKYDRLRDADVGMDATVAVPMAMPVAPDIVQFATDIYVANADAESLVIDVMRLGSLQGPARVRYYTEELSAREGVQYKHSEGTVVIPDGQCNAAFGIPILNDHAWNATLEFKIHLCDPDNCELGLYLKVARVKVIDKTPFPSWDYHEWVSTAEDGTSKDIRLFGAVFWLLTFKDGNVRHVLMTIFFDLMFSVYLILTLLLQIHLVDVVFCADRHSELLIPHRPYCTLVLMSFLYTGPMLLMHAWDVIKIRMDLEGNVRSFMETSLFRKYLNYNEDAKRKVGDTEMLLSVTHNMGNVASGYMAAIRLVQCLVKLFVILCFTTIHNTQATWAVIVMPCVACIIGKTRSGISLAVEAEVGNSESKLLNFVANTIETYQLIADYAQRPTMNDAFKKLSVAAGHARIPAGIVGKNNEYALRWLKPIMVGLWLVIMGPGVVIDPSGLGTFLATLSVFSDIQGSLSQVYDEVFKIFGTFVDYEEAYELLNMPVDVSARKRVNETSIRFFMNWCQERHNKAQDSEDAPVFDEMPIQLDDVSLVYKKDSQAVPVLANVSLSVDQGLFVAVCAPMSAGRRSFLKLLAKSIFPTTGRVLVPAHLRTLYCSEAVFYLDLSLFANLTFGLSLLKSSNILELVLSITGELGLLRISEALQREASETEEQAKNEEVITLSQLTRSEKARIHLARAFIMNPEILIMQRPLSHFDSPPESKRILRLFRDHVRNRGLSLPSENAHRRRPRTLFITLESEEQAQDNADLILRYRTDRKTYIKETTRQQNGSNGAHAAEWQKQTRPDASDSKPLILHENAAGQTAPQERPPEVTPAHITESANNVGDPLGSEFFESPYFKYRDGGSPANSKHKLYCTVGV